MKRTPLFLALGLFLAATPLRAGIVVNITSANPSDNFLTMSISGALTVTSDDSNTTWDVGAFSSDIWRGMARTTGNNIFSSLKFGDYTVGSGITASSGVATISVDDVALFTLPGIPRNDFSFGFAENPSPLFSIGQLITFSGTATINLGTDTAGMFNSGSWSVASSVGEQIWASQFGDGGVSGPDLTLNINYTPGPGPAPVPEPGTWAAAALLAGGAAFARWRKRTKVS